MVRRSVRAQNGLELSMVRRSVRKYMRAQTGLLLSIVCRSVRAQAGKEHVRACPN